MMTFRDGGAERFSFFDAFRSDEIAEIIPPENNEEVRPFHLGPQSFAYNSNEFKI